VSDIKLFSLYSQLPVWAQNVSCSLAGLKMRHDRYNRHFYETLDFLNQSQWWSLAEQQEYQNEQVSKIIHHAYQTVPYYRRVMDERGLKPSDIRGTDDIVKLPVLTKDMIRKLGPELLSSAVPRNKMVHGHTGGTTGKSLQLYCDRFTQPIQWAVWWRHRGRFGLSVDDEFIVFAGRDVVPLDAMSAPFWRRNIPMHQTYVSIHHMTKQNMPGLISYLQERNVKYYSGYPSAIYLVARYMLDNNITLPHPPQATVLGAETLLPHQRSAMEQAFGGRVIDQYGASEYCGNISDCEYGNYHVDMEFGHIELLPVDSGQPNVRQIVCTGFWNEAMPLIRYEIGDLATIPTIQKDCLCGRKSPVVEQIDGRIESYIVTPDGRQAGRLDFIFKDSQNIEEAQFVQNEVSTLVVKVVRSEGYGISDEKTLLATLKKYLGDVISIELDYVSEIPRTKNGKFRQIVSTIERVAMQ
jgi:phenylacetate-CoA ligase